MAQAGKDASSTGGAVRYERHRPETTLLYQLVDAHYPAFADRMAAHGTPLPAYVLREFKDYLRCGRLEHGFLRVRYETCHAEHLVAFSWPLLRIPAPAAFVNPFTSQTARLPPQLWCRLCPPSTNRSRPAWAMSLAFLCTPASQPEPVNVTSSNACAATSLAPPYPKNASHSPNTGQVRYTLKNPWRDGTTHVIFEPLDFIARLAASPPWLVPKPRVNLTRFHGVFAPNSKHRALITPAGRGKVPKPGTTEQAPDRTPVERHLAMTWAQRLKRVFNIDITTCQACGGAMKIIACIEDPSVIRKILDHLDRLSPITAPNALPEPRAPPQAGLFDTP